MLHRLVQRAERRVGRAHPGLQRQPGGIDLVAAGVRQFAQRSGPRAAEHAGLPQPAGQREGRLLTGGEADLRQRELPGGIRYAPSAEVCSGMPRSRSSPLSRSNIRKNASSLAASRYPSTLSPDPGDVPVALRVQQSDHQVEQPLGLGRGLRRRRSSDRLDQLVDPVVDVLERVLQQHGALRLVVELQVHPVDGVVATGVLRRGDELDRAASPWWSAAGRSSPR